MFCTNCGAKVADDLRFCTGCGKPLGAGKPAVPTVAAAAATPPPPAVPAVVRVPAPVVPPQPQPAPVASAAVLPLTVAAAAPPPARVEAKPPPKLDLPSPVPAPQVRSRPEPAAPPEPPAPIPAAKTSSGSKALALVVAALLVGAVAAGYFYFSSSSTQDAATPVSQVPDPGSAQPAAVAQTPVAPQSTTLPTEQPSNQNQPGAPAPPAEASNVAAIETLIQAATSGDAAHLEALIRDVESQPAPAVGNRGEARRINYRALPLLKEKRYAEAIPILEQARLADESDVEVVGNLADTLMRAGKLDEAWSMALVALRLSPRRTVGWSTLGMLSAKRDDASAAVACIVTGYRFSNVQPTTLQVYSKLATTDEDPKVRAALEEAVKRIKDLQ